MLLVLLLLMALGVSTGAFVEIEASSLQLFCMVFAAC
jgi:hypothetical protein